MYWSRQISADAREIRLCFQKAYSNTKLITLTAQLCALAVIFQSAGGLLPFIGYLISPLATAPVALSMVCSARAGLMTYISTMLLLFIIQPGELIIFTFTTGILGLAIGHGFILLNRRISVVLVASVSLFLGINILLFLLKFPIFGPLVSTSFNLINVIAVFIFSFLYSWLWTEFSVILFCSFKKITPP